MKTPLFLTTLGAVALLSACLFSSCTNTGPESHNDFIGQWAGYLYDPPDSIFLVLTFERGGTFHSKTTVNKVSQLETSGTWKRAGNHLLFSEDHCAAGSPPEPVPCLATDSLLINISGDKWTLHETEGGELRTIILERVN